MNRRLLLKNNRLMPSLLLLEPGHVKRAGIHKRADLYKQAFGGGGWDPVTNSGAGWARSNHGVPKQRFKGYDDDAPMHFWGNNFYYPWQDKASWNPLKSAPWRAAAWGEDEVHPDSIMSNNKRFIQAAGRNWLEGGSERQSYKYTTDPKTGKEVPMYYPNSDRMMRESTFGAKQDDTYQRVSGMHGDPELRKGLRKWAEENADELGIEEKWFEDPNWVPDVRSMGMWKEYEHAYDKALAKSDDWLTYTDKMVPGEDGGMVPVGRNISALRRGGKQFETLLGGTGHHAAQATKDVQDYFSDIEPSFVVDADGGLSFASSKISGQSAFGNTMDLGIDFLTGAGAGFVGAGAKTLVGKGLSKILPASIARGGGTLLARNLGTVPGRAAAGRIGTGAGNVYKGAVGAGINKLPTALGNVIKPVLIPGGAKTGVGNVLGGLSRYVGAGTGMSIGAGLSRDMPKMERDYMIGSTGETTGPGSLMSDLGYYENVADLLHPDQVADDLQYAGEGGQGSVFGDAITAKNKEVFEAGLDPDLLAKLQGQPQQDAPPQTKLDTFGLGTPEPTTPTPPTSVTPSITSGGAPNVNLPNVNTGLGASATPTGKGSTSNWLMPAVLGGGTLLGLAGLSGAFDGKKKKPPRKRRRRR